MDMAKCYLRFRPKTFVARSKAARPMSWGVPLSCLLTASIRGLSWDRLWLITLVRSVDRLRGQAYCSLVTAIAEKLDRKLSDWKPETAYEVEKLVAEIIDWADADALDLMRPRHLEQEVLDILDAD
jgi:hypothetical protein